MSFSIKANMSGLDALMNELDASVDEAARPVAQAGAQVLYSAVKSNVSRLGRKTGNLDRSIYQAFSKDNSGPGKATYHVSWNAKTAPHGHLVEYGHIQRYRYFKDSDGNVRPMVRPNMQGKPRPGRRASQATKDAYYVLLPTPLQIAAKPFVRSATSQFAAALEAAKAELYKRLDKVK